MNKKKSLNGLNGLVLMGGPSSRMQSDKSKLDYHGLPQVEHLFSLLQQKLTNVYVSIREGQQVAFTGSTVVDAFDMEGPMNGILSALAFDQHAAWLVLAVDLPLITEQSIDILLTARKAEKVATAMVAEETGQPEPLIAIWEPKAYPLLRKEAAQHNFSPKRFLRHHDTALVRPKNDRELFNANDEADYLQAKKAIAASRSQSNL